MAGKPAAQIVRFEALLKGRPPQVRKWARRLRQIVKSAAPKAAERGYKGWNILVFAPKKEMKMKEMFCGISPLKDSVNLYFLHGVKLPDPHKLLVGAGKTLRAVKIQSDKDLKPAAIKPIVRAAYLHATR
jgi:hypothetical protein